MDSDPLSRLNATEREQLLAWGLSPLPPDQAPRLAPSKNRTVVCATAAGAGARVLVKAATGYRQMGVFREGKILGALEPVAFAPLFIPRRTGYSEALGMVAVEWLEGASTVFHHHRATRRYPPELARALGRALGALHARTHPDPARFDPRDGYSEHSDLLESLLRMRPDFYARQPRVALQLISRLQQDRAAVRSLQSLSDAQHDKASGCLVHGDCKQGNILVPGDRAEPVLIDWELAFWGDGLRDVGWLAADYATGWLAPTHEAEVLPRPELTSFLGELWAAYLAERAAAFPAPPDAGLRAVRWCGMALVVMAYADAHHYRELDERAHKLADYGQYMLAEPEVWAGKLFGSEEGGPR
ncbi:MAG TPA: aminoglycoside phosphotransferase family protein [Myxococcales bacterium]|nr:aminoglycoside phosphotransferase family protein [Myxococcales bacterium]